MQAAPLVPNASEKRLGAQAVLGEGEACRRWCARWDTGANKKTHGADKGVHGRGTMNERKQRMAGIPKPFMVGTGAPCGTGWTMNKRMVITGEIWRVV